MKTKLATLTAAATLCLGFQSAPVSAQQFWIGQIVLGGWNFCPRTTARADGQLLPINSNQALFSLLGCTYGGDCRTTFALPDLRGRAAVNNGSGPGLSPVTLGERTGRESFTPSIATMANHTHTIVNNTSASAYVGPGGSGTFDAGDHLAASASAYSATGAPNQALETGSVAVTVDSTAAPTGGNQQVNIRNPILGLQYCVVTEGIFPSRN